ncbi:MAG: energy transducer TonB [Paucibacter sp.]|nr:energy transducer TonB [Roseateles sp.]
MTLNKPRARWEAFGAAFTIEAIGVSGLLTWWALHPSEPPLRPLPLVIEAAAPAPEPQAPPPPPQIAPPPPVPTPQHVRVQPAPAPPPEPTPEPAPAPTPAPVLAPSLPPAPPAAAIPVAAPTPPPMPPAPAPAGPTPEYRARVYAAAQAAFVYPAAAAAVGFKGRTRINFTLHGTTPVNVHVVVGSGMGLVDRAAVHSVESGNYPPPPPELKGTDVNFELWVDLDKR